MRLGLALFSSLIFILLFNIENYEIYFIFVILVNIALTLERIDNKLSKR